MDIEQPWCAKAKPQVTWLLSFDKIFAQFPDKDVEWKASTSSKSVAVLLAEYRDRYDGYSCTPRPDETGRLPWMDYSTITVANHRAYEQRGLFLNNPCVWVSIVK